MDRIRVALVLLLSCANVVAGAVNTRKGQQSVKRDTPHARTDAWLRSLPGRYLITSPATGASTGLTEGAAQCGLVGRGPAVHCVFEWVAKTSQSSSFRPEMFGLGFDPFSSGIRLLVQDGKRSVDMRGALHDDGVILETRCAKARTCYLSTLQIAASADGQRITMSVDASTAEAQGGGINLLMRHLNSP